MSLSLFSLTLLILPLTALFILYHIYLPPGYLIRFLSHLHPEVLYHVPSPSSPRASPNQPPTPPPPTPPPRTIALTIDDTPSASTLPIAAILSAHNIHATFFVIGSYIPGHEATLHHLLAQGHELANHALHDTPSFRLSAQDLRHEIVETERRIAAIYDSYQTTSPLCSPSMSLGTNPLKPPRYFRPASGIFTRTMLSLLSTLSYRCVLGSIYPHDAQIKWPWLNAWHVCRGVRPGGVIVCHDREWTVEMLRCVLPRIKAAGYRVGSVSEVLRWNGQGEIREEMGERQMEAEMDPITHTDQ